MADALSQRVTAALSGRYRIERELGRGGMATVYLAQDLKHPRRVAIKVLDPEIAHAVGPGRFLREIETVSVLIHPHILPLHDSGVSDGLLYYVMPYVEGESLRERLGREKQLPVEDALRITREVADALDCAHERGVVHRDIKPENILLERGHAVVADFGIARAVASVGREKLTTSGVTVGTPAYMSPEQATGSHDVDGRSDLYSLGCVLYETLAGVPPFAGPTAEILAYQHLNVAPRPVTELRPSVPAAVRDAIAKALAKTRADRFATTRAFAAALATVATHASATAVPTPAATVTAAGRQGWRWRGAVLGGGTALVALAALALWQQWWSLRGSSAPPAKKDWILVAEFDGPPGDSTLAPAARSLLSAALDQSRIVATVPSDQLRAALRAAGKPPGTRVDAELARELAYRSAVRAVLQGMIGRLGKGYSIVVKVVDADTPRVILTRSGTAKDDRALIPALGEIAKELRRGLGENQRAMAATRPMALAATPSFEAYQIYVRTLDRYRMRTANRQAIRGYRAALALDPDFATAWLAMAYPYLNLGYPDSVRMCVAEALRRPDRLTSSQRASLGILQAAADGDDQELVAAYDRVLADDPGNYIALANSNDALWRLGRFEEALERTRGAARLSPFGPTEVLQLNETQGLMLLGRLDEARTANRRQRGVFKVPNQLNIELVAGRFAAVESLAAAVAEDPRALEDFAEGDAPTVALARLGRGDVGAATSGLRASVERCARAGDPVGAEYYRGWWNEVSAVSDGAVPPPPEPAARDTSTSALLNRGLRAVTARDPAVARRCLEAVRIRPRRDQLREGAAPALLEAGNDLLAGRPEEAIARLRPVARPRLGQGGSQTWVCWWLADAFERTGRPDSAAATLERSFRGFFPLDAGERPFVHHRLALLDAKLGRAADAERHLAAAEQAWDHPDPLIRRMLEEARTAVRTARGMSRGETARR